MFRSLVISNILILSLALGLSACSGHSGMNPSNMAMKLPGAKKVSDFKPTDFRKGQTTYWKSTDGLSPNVPGCHVGTDENGVANGRMFGEACLLNGSLVETISSTNKMHRHKNDTGEMVTLDCDQWCRSRGLHEGECTITPAPPCSASAKCTCK